MIHPPPAEEAASLLLVGTNRNSLEALRATFATLRGSLSGCAVVVCQDVEPNDVAAHIELSEDIEVVTALDGRCRSTRGRIHVVPSSSTALNFEGRAPMLRAVRAAEGPAVASAIASFGASLIVPVLADAAAVFTGDELEAVRTAGGVIVHERRGNDRAVRASTTDVGVQSSDVGEAIAQLLRYENQPAIAEQRSLEGLLDDLRAQCGIDFRAYKTATIIRRVGRLMANVGFGSIAEYQAHLRRHPEGYGSLVRSLLINVTEFFRDPPLYDYLREDVVPDLIEYAGTNGNEIRIWSAGCATGEEAYSLAILLSEALGDRIAEFHVRIFATDLDNEAVAVARQGVYPASAFETVPAEYVARYFTHRDGNLEVKKHIRNMTVFGQHDLAQRAPFPRIDLCLCRNVLIYFTKELQQRALQLFSFSLRDDGYLVLGKAESTRPLPEYFRPVHRVFKVYRRHGPRVMIPPSQIRETRPARDHLAAPTGRDAEAERPNPAVIPGLSGVARSLAATNRLGAERQSENERLAALLLDSPVGLVIVDRRYDIVAINQTARTLLNVHGMGLGEDLLHSANGIATAELRVEIDAAFAEETGREPREFRIVDVLNDASRTVLVTTQALRGHEEQPQSVSIVMIDVTAEAGRRTTAERLNDELQGRIEDLSSKIDRLTTRQRALLAANDELTSANAELRGSNEHLLIAAEEAASAAEEIETLNEEMQATNEELETLNEELQATVEELNTTNDELEARSNEYQELATTREDQRVELEHDRDRLRHALDALETPFAIIGDDGSTVYEHPRFHALFPEEYARFWGDDGPLDPAEDPLARARRGELVEGRYLARFPDGRDTMLLVRTRPYASPNDRVRGVMIELQAES